LRDLEFRELAGTQLIIAMETSNVDSKTSGSITSLVAEVSKLSTQLTAYLDKNGHAHPDFTPSTALPPETDEYQAIRNKISDATMDLHRLVNGPLMTIRTLSFSHSLLAAFQVALSRDYFHIVPDNGFGLEASEIAEMAGMDEDRTRRILKILATQRIFEEVPHVCGLVGLGY
jgi:hypothetical protein